MSHTQTISTPVSLSGRGLHTGKNVTVTFNPAPENTGILFRRVDLPGQPVVHALATNVFDTSRGTSLKENEAEVRTVEHLMAALAGLQIDNVIVDIDAEETPILDGSARFYVEALQKAGIMEQQQERDYFVIQEPVSFSLPDKQIELRIEPFDGFELKVDVDYGTAVLANQSAELKDITKFVPEIYNCRTFVFLHELQFLIANNLVKGGDVDNAIVFVAQMPEQQVLDQLSVFFNRKNLKVTENGVLDNVELHFPNEPARHKLLDLIGDLYLLGKPLKGKVYASHPGHFANTEFAKQLLSK
ncbi:MAG: UDP-3-O-[3-hydroxymyristoyl] N-acetylglucosamine deacetylase [Bacteroidales bacterium]|nr:UDP-3-O-[3-hydroxymyristoyl] N-acetylglucosamine deacetylase [Bacteroidales bacterium]